MTQFADVILPLALPKPAYTYEVPDGLVGDVQVGRQVEVSFKTNRRYTGVVRALHAEVPPYATRPILGVLKEGVFIAERQLLFWEWLANYYCCSLGEVMQAALPARLRLSSETRLVLCADYQEGSTSLTEEERRVVQALLSREKFGLLEVQKILGKKTVMPVVQRLLNKGVLTLQEELQERPRSRKIRAVRLAEPYRSDPGRLTTVLDRLAAHERVQRLVLAYLSLSRQRPWIDRREILAKAAATEKDVNALLREGVLEEYDPSSASVTEVDREAEGIEPLTEQQRQAVEAIGAFFAQKKPVLLHGVTGSGKTRVYVELIRKTVRAGGQVLYMLPEIALTTQMIRRLQRFLGTQVAVYHSKIGDGERAVVWSAASEGKPVVLTARSGIFLPFKNLQLVIVDEEHDPSFKQQEPAPRYHGRDSALYLAHLWSASIVLGTATPSVESWYNAQIGKYGYVSMPHRYGEVPLPEIQLIDSSEQHQKGQMQGLFSKPLLEAIQKTVEQGEQVLLFQNRRGYSPVLECRTCGWTATCLYCDVNLTYHKRRHLLQCHYCGHAQVLPATCPACHSARVVLLGAGTEKVEDELKIFFPKLRIARIDLDTAGTRNRLNRLLSDFEQRQIDVLVGTQMVTKGLDFDNIGLVGVLNADRLMHFPDFRSGERAFQLLLQVAGRAGRKHKRGTVLVQSWNIRHPVLQEALRGDVEAHLQRELNERQRFLYPPFVRLIRLQVRHPQEASAALLAQELAVVLRQQLGRRVLGPTQPLIGRIRNHYIQEIWLKLEKSAPLLASAKSFLLQTVEQKLAQPGWQKARIYVDVDPH